MLLGNSFSGLFWKERGPSCHKGGNWRPICELVPPISVLRLFRSLLSLPMYPFICPFSLKCGFTSSCWAQRIRAGHPESRALNCPLFKVGTQPPHNSDMAYGLETGNNNNNNKLCVYRWLVIMFQRCYCRKGTIAWCRGNFTGKLQQSLSWLAICMSPLKLIFVATKSQTYHVDFLVWCLSSWRKSNWR